MGWKEERNCKQCENGVFDSQNGSYRCKNNKQEECFDYEDRELKLFLPRANKTKEVIADETAYELYGFLKAKIFNLLESQIPAVPDKLKLDAVKKIAEDYISSASAIVKQSILNK